MVGRDGAKREPLAAVPFVRLGGACDPFTVHSSEAIAIGGDGGRGVSVALLLNHGVVSRHHPPHFVVTAVVAVVDVWVVEGGRERVGMANGRGLVVVGRRRGRSC